MKKWWLGNAIALSHEPADLYSGNRKIIRRVTQTLDGHDYQRPLNLADLGYTSAKMKMLERYYIVPESIAVAQEAWRERLKKGKYNSTCFTTYAHFDKKIKGGLRKPLLMGPCIQSVILTLIPKNEMHVDCFYRSTEYFKKFPADLVFIRDRLLAQFDCKLAPVTSIAFHFANVTVHPMYYPCMFPEMRDPMAEMDRLKRADPKFYKLCVSWAARYFLPKKYGKGIERFSQARRTGECVLDLLDASKIKDIAEYVDAHYKPAREDPDDGDEDI